MMSDAPNSYREPAIVETPEQRVERTRKIYWAVAATNVAARTPEDLEAIERAFRRASNAYLKAIDALEASKNGR